MADRPTPRMSRSAYLLGTQPDTDDRVEGAGDPGACPCCGDPVAIAPDATHRCPTCNYPDNSAAWVAYDGCC